MRSGPLRVGGPSWTRPAKRGPSKGVSTGRSVLERAEQLPATVQFRAARQTLICVRRKMRREVMFAFDKTRRGAGSRRRRFNKLSEVKC